MLLILLILILLFCGGGFYGHSNWGPQYGYGFGEIGATCG